MDGAIKAALHDASVRPAPAGGAAIEPTVEPSEAAANPSVDRFTLSDEAGEQRARTAEMSVSLERGLRKAAEILRSMDIANQPAASRGAETAEIIRSGLAKYYEGVADSYTGAAAASHAA